MFFHLHSCCSCCICVVTFANGMTPTCHRKNVTPHVVKCWQSFSFQLFICYQIWHVKNRQTLQTSVHLALQKYCNSIRALHRGLCEFAESLITVSSTKGFHVKWKLEVFSKWGLVTLEPFKEISGWQQQNGGWIYLINQLAWGENGCNISSLVPLPPIIPALLNKQLKPD